jgi:glutathione peroxidase
LISIEPFVLSIVSKEKSMKKTLILLALMTASFGFTQNSIHDFSFKTLDGQDMSFKDFKGKKILIVNTASECGFTPQYEGLQELHKKMGDKLVIIGFPANNFGKQEPGENKDIAVFCKKNYGVEFTMAAKVSVKGEDINEIFEWLCNQNNPDFKGGIKWNFEKFLLDEEGKLMKRYRSGVKPMSEKITSNI